MLKSLSIYLSLCLSASLYAASFQGLGDLPGGSFFSQCTGISHDGKTIVGSSLSANGMEAFRWTQTEGMVPLGDLPGAPFQSGAASVSGDGSIIVGQGNLAGNYRAFHYTQDIGMVELPSSVTVNNQTYNYSTIATGMSADGSVIVGNANYSSPPHHGNPGDKPCYWTDGQLHVLTPPGYQSWFSTRVTGMSDDGSIILITTDYNNGYLWSESGGFQELPTFAETGGPIYLMSGDATVFGGYDRDAKTSFLWSEEDGLTQLEIPDGWDDNQIGGINADGSFVAGSLVADEHYSAPDDPQYFKPYFWDEQNGIRLVENILAGYGIELNGWNLTGAWISRDGSTVYGTGINPDGFDEAWVATIPEPATMLLTLSGALVAFRRKS
ncbi:MAG: hypothetical protein ACYTEN_00845 [Planctomycetota bacterium]